jgi:hypothetical protein
MDLALPVPAIMQDIVIAFYQVNGEIGENRVATVEKAPTPCSGGCETDRPPLQLPGLKYCKRCTSRCRSSLYTACGTAIPTFENAPTYQSADRYDKRFGFFPKNTSRQITKVAAAIIYIKTAPAYSKVIGERLFPN